jgi:hypothetical protein
MRQCWPDGMLRALADRELPADELARLSAHLEECPQCRARCRELSARAERVLGLVGGLAEPAVDLPSVRPMPKPVAMPRLHTGRWVAAAVALAAGWAALALLSPKPVQAPAATHVQAPTVEAPHEAEVPEPPKPMAVHTPVRVMPRAARRAFPAAPPRATLAGFMPLDDDPIDAGVVMRVALAAGQQADVIYSSDGRPRAIRLVNDPTGK